MGSGFRLEALRPKLCSLWFGILRFRAWGLGCGAFLKPFHTVEILSDFLKRFEL